MITLLFGNLIIEKLLRNGRKSEVGEYPEAVENPKAAGNSEAAESFCFHYMVLDMLT